MHHDHDAQEVLARRSGSYARLLLPGPSAELFAGVRWGRFDEPLTPAFWAARAFIEAPLGQLNDYRLGRTLREEVAGCLLGGYGMPAETALAAFDRLRQEGALAPGTTRQKIQSLLSTPLNVGERHVRYRFARQKAGYLADALAALEEIGPLPEDDREFRAVLLRLPGVGPKTASWITRNIRESDEVAILDVHICRACEAASVFSPGSSPARNYFGLEARYLKFAAAVGVRASMLDNLIWQTMRRLAPYIVRKHT